MPNKPKMQSYNVYKYSLVDMVFFGTVEILGGGSTLNTHFFYKDEDTATTALTLFLCPARPVGAVAIGATVSSSGGSGTPAEITIAAYTQEGTASLVTASGGAACTATDVSAVALHATNFGSAGDMVDVLGFKDPRTDANYTELSYVQSNDDNPGNVMLPVANQMEAQKAVIRQRGTNGVSLTQNYVDNNTGIPKLRGREVTLLIEVHENGGPVVTEYQMFGQCAVGEVSKSDPENALSIISASGTYRKKCVYAV